jgi:hypothetical protein
MKPSSSQEEHRREGDGSGSEDSGDAASESVVSEDAVGGGGDSEELEEEEAIPVATQARPRSQSGSAPPRTVKRLNLGRPGCGGAAAQQDTIGHGHHDGVGVRTLATMNQLDPRVVHARAVAAGVEPRVIYARLAAAQMDRTSDTGEVQAGEGTVGDVEDSSEEGSREGSDQGSDEAEGKDDDGADERRADEAPQNPRTKTIVVDPGHVSMAVTLRRRRVPKNQAKMKARCTLLVNRRTPSRRAIARSKEYRRRGIVHPTRQLEQPSSKF